MQTEYVEAGRLARWVGGAAMLLICGMGVGRDARASETVTLTDSLYATAFVDANSGWAVGAFGTIFRTGDGGKSWRVQESGTAEHLFGVDFVDGQHGWAVGRLGIVLQTQDGGETWEARNPGVQHHLFDVHALDAQHVRAVGDWGSILSSVDGGRSWQTYPLERDVILNAQAWPDARHGWIVGENGLILATSDGGASWEEQSSGVLKTLFGVCFRGPRHGWAVGLDGLILHTADGGNTWEIQRGDPEVSMLEQVGFKEAFDNPSLYAVAVTSTYGYAVGDNGAVFFSADGGLTWARKSVPDAANLRWIRSVSLVNGTHGLLVGANGMTIRAERDEIMLTGN